MKTRVGLLCGGLSGEHQVSLISAHNILQAIPRAWYEVTLIGVRKDGTWCWRPEGDLLCETDDVRTVRLHSESVTLHPHPGGLLRDMRGHEQSFEVFFPITHGAYGEDGTLQGYLRWLQVPFVGCDVWGAAICMDKDVTKRLLAHAEIPVVPSVTLRQQSQLSFAEASDRLGLPLFVKPAREGSSLGVAKVRTEAEYHAALEAGFGLDRKVLLETAIVGREIEVAVLGNAAPSASSAVGEIIPRHDFYSYEAKYVDAEGAALKIPAEMPEAVREQIREYAVKAYQVTECLGMARVDFFLTEDHQIFLNEINTLPGFTSISMYPKLWEASGLEYSELLHQLLQLAVERRR